MSAERPQKERGGVIASSRDAWRRRFGPSLRGGAAAAEIRRMAVAEREQRSTSPDGQPHDAQPATSGEKWSDRAKTTVKVLAVGTVVAVGAIALVNGNERRFKKKSLTEATLDVATKVKEGKKTGGKMKKAAKFAGPIMISGIGGTTVDALALTLDEHREKTHRSARLDKRLRKFIEFSRRSLGAKDPRIWPDVHFDHHALADINLYPMFKSELVLRWLEAEHAQGRLKDIVIPETIKHMDPMVDDGEYDTGLVREIGSLAIERAEKKLGALHQPPASYTREQVMDALYPTAPDYYYPKYRKMKREDYTSDDLARIVLVDPHSPVYADRTERNGVKKTFMYGIWNYNYAADARKAFPEIISPLLDEYKEDPPKDVWPAVAAGVLGPAAVIYAVRGERQPKDVGLALAGGVLWDATRGAGEALGSMAVNGLGHAGDRLTLRTLLHAALGREYKIRLHEDGTVASDITNVGILPKVLGLLTADEVTLQDGHHKRPHEPKYSEKTGWRGLVEAPWGTAVEAAANSKRFTLIQPGEGFKLAPGEKRPDEPAEETILIQNRRKIQYQVEKAREMELFSAAA